ncbi:MAG: hypothetical protein M1828_007067 [Chrysothrix sp. TS-e1954]|nr:MAG: hypothetical protein M1828_007067 [Chrysothrix sp. TS-e1954]
MTMAPPHPEDLNVPWCQTFLQSPSLKRIPMDSLTHSGPTGPHENSFLAKTLSTSTGLRACIALRREGSSTTRPEVFLLVSIGTGLSSHSEILAGGVCSALLDEMMGLAAQDVFKRMREETFFTVGLDVGFKKPVRVPGVYLCRASVTKIDKRRLWAEGTIEDGEAEVYVAGKGVFIKTGVASL